MTSPDFEALLEASGVAVAVVAPDRTLSYASPTFKARAGIGNGAEHATGPLEPGDTETHATWTRGGVTHACRLSPLPGGSVAMTLLGAAPGPRDRATAMALLQSVLSLTLAEADAAWRHAQGASLRAIAEARGVSRETVRTQMRTVRAKAGCATGRELQAKIFALLAAPECGAAS